MIEDQRQASEDLFGEIMDFRGGLPQGQQMDRALAGIQWIHDEFKKKLPNYLTAEQRAAWEESEAAGVKIAAQIEGSGTRRTSTEQILQIRVNNNPFTSEEGAYSGFGGGGGSFQSGGNFQGGGNFPGGAGGNFQSGGGGNRGANLERTEIIQRGGTGAFHGSFAANLQDESLNARNPYADNKPPYRERTAAALQHI